ncbi:hypothetical protein Tco_0285974 [Tanacetum coccineum]
MRKASELERSLEDREVAPPKEDMIRHHPRKDKSTIPPDKHTTPKREGKEPMKQDEAIKGATQPEKIRNNDAIFTSSEQPKDLWHTTYPFPKRAKDNKKNKKFK